MYFLTVHFETCGLPETHSPIVLDALLFDEQNQLVDRFYDIVKPYDHFKWDDGANGVHKLTRQFVDQVGSDYKEVAKKFNNWISKYEDISLICWDAHVTAINCAYFAVGTQTFLGCDKLPLRDVIDMKQVFRFYMKDFKYKANIPHVLESWNIVQDVALWGQVGTVPSRGMAHKLYLIFITLKGSK